MRGPTGEIEKESEAGHKATELRGSKSTSLSLLACLVPEHVDVDMVSLCLSSGLGLGIGIGFKGLYFCTIDFSFHVEWCIRQLGCFSIILYITSIATNNHTMALFQTYNHIHINIKNI